jgi:protein-tyrosine phosphatase
MEKNDLGRRWLDIPTGDNVRELGGYDTPYGPTAYHRFLRSGSTQYLNDEDIGRLRDYGVTHVLDLRGSYESPSRTCAFCRRGGFVWRNVELYECDVSRYRRLLAKRATNYLEESYLGMLSNPGAVRRIVSFCARAPLDACVLFHCAAGMDRTGVCAMLLLGVAGVSREQVVDDYAYSFGTAEEVERERLAKERMHGDLYMSMGDYMGVIETVWDAVLELHGSLGAYLRACGVEDGDVGRLRARLLER